MIFKLFLLETHRGPGAPPKIGDLTTLFCLRLRQRKGILIKRSTTLD